MRLKNIRLKNYRCFKEAEIDFDTYRLVLDFQTGDGNE